MLKSLDLFSGIGGITHALRDVAEPVAYCDWDVSSRACLKTLMGKKLIPTAPVSEDVRSLNKAWLKSHSIQDVDIIVAGFPCVGFSPLGLREAFENDESSLFGEILRLTDSLKPPMLFIENVPNVLSLGMDKVVEELSIKRGYELRYAIVSARMVGALHKRSRWFCLAVKPGFEFSLKNKCHYAPFDFSCAEPARSSLRSEPSDDVRKAMLGNSVVPDAVRYAFLYLASRLSVSPSKLSLEKGYSIVPAQKTGKMIKDEVQVQVKKEKGEQEEKHTFGSRGIIEARSGKKMMVLGDSIIELAPFKEHVGVKLVFDAEKYKAEKPPSKMMTTGVLEKPLVAHAWSTPRKSNTKPANYLTHRSVRDLATQVRFEKKTVHRKGEMTPDFVEYLMGYEKGWTRLS